MAIESPTTVDVKAQLQMLEAMLRIRAFETAANQLYLSAKMPGLTHLYIGEEAVAVGVCSALRVDDVITSTHRGHGHCIAKGADVRRMFCELLGKEEGDEVNVTAPNGSRRFELVKLITIHDE